MKMYMNVTSFYQRANHIAMKCCPLCLKHPQTTSTLLHSLSMLKMARSLLSGRKPLKKKLTPNSTSDAQGEIRKRNSFSSSTSNVYTT